MNKLTKRIKHFFDEEKGMSTIEVVLLIVVLVGLALLFKDQIMGIANGIFASIKLQIRSF